MSVAEVERLLRIGMCSPAKAHETGCTTCAACERAIAFVKALEADRDAQVERRTIPRSRRIRTIAEDIAAYERGRSDQARFCNLLVVQACTEVIQHVADRGVPRRSR